MYYCTIIKDLMKSWKEESGVRAIILYNMKREKNEYDDSEITLEICTNRPGPLIGFRGSLVDKYRDLISQKIKKKVFVKFIETVEIV